MLVWESLSQELIFLVACMKVAHRRDMSFIGPEIDLGASWRRQC